MSSTGTHNCRLTVTFSRPKQITKSSQKSSQKILELLKENNSITIKQMAERIQISDRAIKKNLAKLKSNGIIKRVGPDKGGYWEIID